MDESTGKKDEMEFEMQLPDRKTVVVDTGNKVRSEVLAYRTLGQREAVWKMPSTFRVVMGMPSHRVGVSQPPKEVGQLRVSLWPDNKVPMIRHHHIRRQRMWNASVCFRKHSLEGSVITTLLKQSDASNGEI